MAALQALAQLTLPAQPCQPQAGRLPPAAFAEALGCFACLDIPGHDHAQLLRATQLHTFLAQLARGNSSAVLPEVVQAVGLLCSGAACAEMIASAGLVRGTAAVVWAWRRWVNCLAYQRAQILPPAFAAHTASRPAISLPPCPAAPAGGGAAHTDAAPHGRRRLCAGHHRRSSPHAVAGVQAAGPPRRHRRGAAACFCSKRRLRRPSIAPKLHVSSLTCGCLTLPNQFPGCSPPRTRPCWPTLRWWRAAPSCCSIR